MSLNPVSLSSGLSGKSHTILLVEDEKGVRDLIRSMLLQRGYSVLFAGDSEAAMKIASMHFGDIDLLIADVVMPGLNGPELARRLRAKRPNLRVLFISGFVREAAVQHATLPNVVFLEKPFPPETLVGKVQEILQTGSA